MDAEHPPGAACQRGQAGAACQRGLPARPPGAACQRGLRARPASAACRAIVQLFDYTEQDPRSMRAGFTRSDFAARLQSSERSLSGQEGPIPGFGRRPGRTVRVWQAPTLQDQPESFGPAENLRDTLDRRGRIDARQGGGTDPGDVGSGDAGSGDGAIRYFLPRTSFAGSRAVRRPRLAIALASATSWAWRSRSSSSGASATSVGATPWARPTAMRIS